MNKTRSVLFGLIAGGLLLGGLIYGSFSVVQTECDVCVEFRGQRQCRSGSGTDEQEARDAAVRASCAVMAAGMDASIACQNTPPVSQTCGP